MWLIISRIYHIPFNHKNTTNPSAEQSAQISSSLINSLIPLPPLVLDKILSMMSDDALCSVLRTSKPLRDLAIPHIYRRPNVFKTMEHSISPDHPGVQNLCRYHSWDVQLLQQLWSNEMPNLITVELQSPWFSSALPQQIATCLHSNHPNNRISSISVRLDDSVLYKSYEILLRHLCLFPHLQSFEIVRLQSPENQDAFTVPAELANCLNLRTLSLIGNFEIPDLNTLDLPSLTSVSMNNLMYQDDDKIWNRLRVMMSKRVSVVDLSDQLEMLRFVYNYALDYNLESQDLRKWLIESVVRHTSKRTVSLLEYSNNELNETFEIFEQCLSTQGGTFGVEFYAANSENMVHALPQGLSNIELWVREKVSSTLVPQIIKRVTGLRKIWIRLFMGRTEDGRLGDIARCTEADYAGFPPLFSTPDSLSGTYWASEYLLEMRRDKKPAWWANTCGDNMDYVQTLMYMPTLEKEVTEWFSVNPNLEKIFISFNMDVHMDEQMDRSDTDESGIDE